MKALLWKDICLLRRQLRLFIFAMLVFAAIPNSYIQLFAVAYASMLPYNTIALDEQSHWDQLAAMMPYSDRDMVLSKYLVGWGGCLAVGALALAAGVVERPFFPAAAAPQAVLAILCTGLIMVAVSMPVLFRFGVAKGRFMILIMVMLVCGCAGAASGVLSDTDGIQLSGGALLLVAAIAAAANLISVPIAARMYRKKREG